MSDVADNTSLQEQLAALIAAQQANAPTTAQPGGWGQPAQSMPPKPVGVAIPIKVDTPQGSVRTYIQYGHEAIESPQALLAVINALMQAGYPVDAWVPRQQGGYGGGRGGYGGSRGGYGGGYGGGRGNGW